MAVEDTLDCKIFVESDMDIDRLTSVVAKELQGSPQLSQAGGLVRFEGGEAEVRRNEDVERGLAQKFPDGFLHFRYVIEFYPSSDPERVNRVDITSRILETLW